MPPPSCSCLSARKSYGAGAALHPTTLDVPAGRTTVLIGPSGCGKTTALRLMMGLLRPDSGEVRFRDTVLTVDNVRALRTQMGYVVQDGGLFPHLTSVENVTLMARHLDWSPQRVAERVGRWPSWCACRRPRCSAIRPSCPAARSSEWR